VNGSILPLREVARRAVTIARPYAGDAVDGVERILTEGGGADRQRAVQERDGTKGLLAYLVERTAA
jgi:hypothetical protein